MAKNTAGENDKAKDSLLWTVIRFLMSQIRFQVSFYIKNHNIDWLGFFLKLIKHQQLKAHLQRSCEGFLAELVFCPCMGRWESDRGWQLLFSGGPLGRNCYLGFIPGLWLLWDDEQTDCLLPHSTLGQPARSGCVGAKCANWGCQPLVEC